MTTCANMAICSEHAPPLEERHDLDFEIKPLASVHHCGRSSCNLSGATTTRLGNFVHGLSLNPSRHVFYRHIATRVTNLALAPLSLIPATIDTLAGVIAGTEVFLSLGRERKVVNFATRELHAINDFFSKQYEFLLRVINPKAHFASRRVTFVPHRVTGNSIAATISDMPAVAGVIGRVAIKVAHHNNVFVRNIVSRGTFALTAVAAVVSRVVYAVLAVPALPLSVLTLGNCRKLNTITSRGLSVGGVIDDIFICAVKVMNPWAGDEDPEVVRLQDLLASYRGSYNDDANSVNGDGDTLIVHSDDADDDGDDSDILIVHSDDDADDADADDSDTLIVHGDDAGSVHSSDT